MECYRIFLFLLLQNNVRVAVLGASGGIGQPLSLLLKINPKVTQLNIFDIQHTLGVAADLSHIDTPAKVQGFNGLENLCEALKGKITYFNFLLKESQLIYLSDDVRQTPRLSSSQLVCHESLA